MITTSLQLQDLAQKLRVATQNANDVLLHDDGDGLCISDLEAAICDVRAVIYDIETAASSLMSIFDS